MDLYFSPMACSLAARITLYEAGVDARFIEVDGRAKRTLQGDDYWQVNAMGQVPALRTDDGVLLTENAAVLQYLAARHPQDGLLPDGELDRARLQQWLCFIGTELHKATFVPLLDTQAGAEVKTYARAKVALRLGLLQDHLEGREHLLDRYSVADAYLATVLNWAPYAGVELSDWPAVQAYHRRIARRPAVARAMAEEFALYQAEQARR